MNIFKKSLFLVKRPCVILVTGKGASCAAQAIYYALKPNFKVSRNMNVNAISILESDLKSRSHQDMFKFIAKHSKLPILVVSHVGDIPGDKEFFAGPKRETAAIRRVAEALQFQGYLILNFDDETVREIKSESIAHLLTYGFQKGADFQVTDINFDLQGTNFKVNYQGNIVPFWLKNLFGKEQAYSALSAIAVGIVKDVNLVEMSQALKNYDSFPGKMKLIKGIKGSLILDDSQNATLLSMIEALSILKQLSANRKVAILGDVLGIGKYAIEAHETIGEKVAKSSDLLFAVGGRAKFIAQGATKKGMSQKKIFQFDTVDQAKLAVQKEIKKDDLILIDGALEMKMKEIVKEIKD